MSGRSVRQATTMRAGWPLGVRSSRMRLRLGWCDTELPPALSIVSCITDRELTEGVTKNVKPYKIKQEEFHISNFKMLHVHVHSGYKTFECSERIL